MVTFATARWCLLLLQYIDNLDINYIMLVSLLASESIFVDQEEDGDEAVPVLVEKPTRYTSLRERFFKERDDISCNSGTWICVD